MKKTVSVTIGIPAYNEEKNICNLLTDILAQKGGAYNVSKIIIASDGSSDKTVKSVKKFKDKRIEVINGKKRIGKPARINLIARKTKTDVLVLLDSDIRLKNDTFLVRLITPFYKHKDVALTSGYAIPLQPKNSIENIAYAGIKIWEQVRDGLINADMYYCEGSARALNKKLYTKIKFPNFSADDVYVYLFCMKLGYRFVRVSGAVALYKLPETVNDYLKQQIRYLQSKKIQEHNFSKEYITSHYVINTKDRVSGFVSYFNRNPFWTSLYVIFIILPKFLVLISDKGSEATWEVLKTTKRLKNAN